MSRVFFRCTAIDPGLPPNKQRARIEEKEGGGREKGEGCVGIKDEKRENEAVNPAKREGGSECNLRFVPIPATQKKRRAKRKKKEKERRGRWEGIIFFRGSFTRTPLAQVCLKVGLIDTPKILSFPFLYIIFACLSIYYSLYFSLLCLLFLFLLSFFLFLFMTSRTLHSASLQCEEMQQK